MRHLADGTLEGEDPLGHFSPTAPAHLLRTDGFRHVADIMVGSFYDPELEEGCAFEELISFHGGLGGLQTRPFILYPKELAAPDRPIVGAAAVHGVLSGWRRDLQGADAVPLEPPPEFHLATSGDRERRRSQLALAISPRCCARLGKEPQNGRFKWRTT